MSLQDALPEGHGRPFRLAGLVSSCLKHAAEVARLSSTSRMAREDPVRESCCAYSPVALYDYRAVIKSQKYGPMCDNFTSFC